MKYEFIEERRHQYPVKTMCRALEVSECGYYAWRKRPKSEREQENEKLTQRIKQVYEQNRETYGSPRIHVELKDVGVKCSRKRVARLMRVHGICAQHKRRRMCTTDSKHSNPVAENRLKREFTASEPNTKWAGDITGVETAQGWLYLAVVVELYSRCVVGWSMSAQRDEALFENALTMALSRRRPAAGLIFHSDRGSQYTSHRYQELLKQHEIIASMSRKAIVGIMRRSSPSLGR